ncbi:MAG: DUF305 domain-containing protein [Gemmatimonadetes bacterium]|nr:DUF305 domain-containing protein [Gemmatimonadota bacterium]
MRTKRIHHGATPILALAVATLVAACGSSSRTPGTTTTTPAPDPSTLERAARADSLRESYNQADVDFMQGMIHHHAQALVMSAMAPTHGASAPLRIMAARIINGQKDEIALMQRWLRERGEAAPAVSEDGTVSAGGQTGHAGHGGHGGHDAHAGHGASAMPGMLTSEQMARLDAARGEEFDRLFLTYMIQHHRGALTMVEDLFATYGAAQGDEIFKIASDISADQASEIDRMQRMLRALILGTEDRP